MGIISKEIYIYCGNMCSFFFFFTSKYIIKKVTGANDLEKFQSSKGQWPSKTSVNAVLMKCPLF